MDELTGFELLEKRVEWLDNERRTDKTILASLQNRLIELENENIKLAQQVKELNGEVSGLRTKVIETNKYDARIERVSSDLSKKINETDEKLAPALNETVKRFKLEIDAIHKAYSPLLTLPDAITANQTSIKSQHTEDVRLSKLIEELKLKIVEVSRFDEDYKRSLFLLEESLRQDTKRYTDLQGEVVAQRKRIEENRSRIDMTIDNFRQFDKRINELQTYEKDRREAQAAFVEKINMQTVERERTFKEWKVRIDAIDKIDLGFENQIDSLEKIQRSVEKSLLSLDEVTTRFDRRINEISEIQRLNEERFRQEWTTFKADDQKRWTNYSLGQEEQFREIRSELESLASQITSLDEITRSMEDVIQQSNKETVKRLQLFLHAYQDSLQSASNLDKTK